MYNLLTNIAAQRSDVELMIHIGNLEEGLQAILDNRDKRIDAIISRGGTTEVIRRSCSIPVCDITPSAYDILRTIRLAQGMSERFAVIGFPSISEPTRMLCEILQYDCQVITIHSEEECNRSLQQLKDDGIRIIVGDTIFMMVFMLFGMRLFVSVLKIPKNFLLPVIIVLCGIGAIGNSNNVFDTYSMVAFGLMSYLLIKSKIPTVPMILGFILGPMFEENLRRVSQLSSSESLFSHPISCVFIVVTVIVVIFSVRANRKDALRAQQEELAQMAKLKAARNDGE